MRTCRPLLLCIADVHRAEHFSRYMPHSPLGVLASLLTVTDPDEANGFIGVEVNHPSRLDSVIGYHF